LPGVRLHANANRHANSDGHTRGAALPGIGLHADADGYSNGCIAHKHRNLGADADAHRHAAPWGCG
jgi:hypothetical protein